MTPEERRIIANRLIEQQRVLRDVFESCQSQGDFCNSLGAKRMAFAIYMVRESLIVYSKELNTFVLRFINEESLTDEEFPIDT